MENTKLELKLLNMKNKFETRFRFKMYGENEIKNALYLNYADINVNDISDEEFEKYYKNKVEHLIDLKHYKEKMCFNDEFSSLDDWNNIKIPTERTELYIDFVVVGEYVKTDSFGYVIISNAISYHEVVLDNGVSLVTSYRNIGESSPGSFWDQLYIMNKILEDNIIVFDFEKAELMNAEK